MHRFFISLVLLVLILAVVPLAACGDDNSDSEVPERIISLAPSNTEILFALGLGDRVVGVTEFCDYPEAAKSKQKVGGYSTPDMEKVVSLNPDLVLAAAIHEGDVVPELKRRGIRVITLKPTTIDEVLNVVIPLVGVVTGTDEASSALVTSLKARVDAVTEKVNSISAEEKPGVFYITWPDPLFTVGSDTLIHEIIQMAGGVNIFADAEDHFETDLETVVWRNPDIILASSGSSKAEDSPVYWAQEEERLSGINARLNGRVYGVDGNLFNRPGPRIVDGLEQVAKLIYPELFSE